MTDTGGNGPPQVEYAFGHDPGAPSVARSLLSGWLTEPDDVLNDDVHLAVSEMVTNVSRTPTTVGCCGFGTLAPWCRCGWR